MANRFDTSTVDPGEVALRHFSKGFGQGLEKAKFDRSMAARKAKDKDVREDNLRKENAGLAQQEKSNTRADAYLKIQQENLELNKAKSIAEHKQFGLKKEAQKVSDFFDRKIFGEHKKVIDADISANKFQYGQASVELARRGDIFRKRQQGMDMAWNRGESARVIIGMDNNIPVYLKDEKGNDITFASDPEGTKDRKTGQQKYDLYFQDPNNVDPTNSPFESGESDKDPNTSKFLDTATLLNAMRDASERIEKKNSERNLLYYKRAKKIGNINPRDIGMYENADKHLGVSGFLQLTRINDLDGLSDNQKQGLIEDIVNMGGPQVALQRAYALNKPEHAQWLQKFLIESTLNPDGVYDAPMAPAWYRAPTSMSQRIRGERGRMGAAKGRVITKPEASLKKRRKFGEKMAERDPLSNERLREIMEPLRTENN